jgi:hypothetical protein
VLFALKKAEVELDDLKIGFMSSWATTTVKSFCCGAPHVAARECGEIGPNSSMVENLCCIRGHALL